MTNLAIASDQLWDPTDEALPGPVVRDLVAWSERDIDALQEELDLALWEAEFEERRLAGHPAARFMAPETEVGGLDANHWAAPPTSTMPAVEPWVPDAGPNLAAGYQTPAPDMAAVPVDPWIPVTGTDHLAGHQASAPDVTPVPLDPWVPVAGPEHLVDHEGPAPTASPVPDLAGAGVSASPLAAYPEPAPPAGLVTTAPVPRATAPRTTVVRRAPAVGARSPASTSAAGSGAGAPRPMPGWSRPPVLSRQPPGPISSAPAAARGPTASDPTG